MKTVAIVQARLGSSRLHAKVLLDIGGQTMLQRVMNRLSQSKRIDQVVVATTDQPTDELLVQYCLHQGWNYFCGSENDVLSRYVGAAKQYQADYIVRITSDCPLIDPDVVDAVVAAAQADPAIDYTCNFFPYRWFPRGLDCECLPLRMLKKLDELAQQKKHREHVTLFAYENPALFKLASIRADMEFSSLRWTVDTQEDIELVREIYLHFDRKPFRWRDIIRAYEHFPHWSAINEMVNQKAA